MKKKLLWICLLLSTQIGILLQAQTLSHKNPTLWKQKRNINDEWYFQRLPKTEQFGEIKEQGTDWHSQFNVEHIETKEKLKRLAIPQDTLYAELEILKNGSWTPVQLPHTPFIEELTVVHQWQGICYYKKHLTLTAQELSNHVLLEFEGAMQLADVWINGTHVTQHAGGYTPFLIDITSHAHTGENEILIRLDNRNNSIIPPGKPLNKLDFCYYGGIYRDVNLIIKPLIHITHPICATKPASGGIFITYPEVSEEKATINIRTEIANPKNNNEEAVVKQTLFEWSRQSGKGKIVKTDSRKVALAGKSPLTLEQTLLIESPRLWHPEAPHLYLLTTEVIINKQIIDYEETRVGIRHFEISREKGFVINGKPLRLVGCNRHMEYPYVGNAIPDRAQYRDIYHIRNNGFNIVRLGHYLQDPSVLDACDELGLLVIEPIPGWQFFNKDSIFQELTYQNIRELIRRDRNHPSILMWETTLNESWPPKEWKDKAIAVAHEEFPGNQCFTSGDMYGYQGFDILYNDWNEDKFTRPNESDKPGFIREYYDYEFGGHHSSTRIKREDGQQALLQNAWNAQWSHNRNRTLYPYTMGDAVWSMYDYNRGCSENICHSGMADLFRLPKFSLPFFRLQRPEGYPLPKGKMPYELFIASFWEAEHSDTVMVYGNVEEVALYLNGQFLQRIKADNGPDTDYIPSPDKGNCRHLDFPPFTFTGIQWQSGNLKAVGYNKGKKVVESHVSTPLQPQQLKIEYFESGYPATQNDLLIVYVHILDKKGTICPINDSIVHLNVEGGEIIGPNSFQSKAGIASFLVRTHKAEALSIKAHTKRLSARRKINLK